MLDSDGLNDLLPPQTAKEQKQQNGQSKSQTGRGTPLYKPYRYMPLHWVGFLRCFGLKMGIHFAHFDLESGWIFKGTTGVYEHFYRFNSKWVRKKEKYANSKWIWIVFVFVP